MTPAPHTRVVVLALFLGAPCVSGAVRAQAPCPGAADAPAAEGWSAYADGDVSGARARFEEALSRCPDHRDARTGLGYVNLRRGSEGTARTLFRRVVSEDPENVDARVGLGLLAWRDGDLDEVDRQFREVLRLVPGHFTAGRFLARAEEAREVSPVRDEADRAWRAGEGDRAARLYSARVAADSSDTPALRRLALLRARGGRHAEALELMEALIELEPENVGARVDRARILAWSGRVQEAVEHLDVILAEEPGSLPALAAKARFLTWAAQEDALRSPYETAGGAAPEPGPGGRVEPRAVLDDEEFRAAVAVYDARVARDPEAVAGRVGLARALAFAGRYDSARAVFRGVLERHPGNVEAQVGLAGSLAWSGDLVGAERAWRQAGEMDPGSLDVMVGLAQTLRWQGRTAAALAVLERARRRSPGDPEVESQLRWVRTTVEPGVHPSFSLEGDSEQNTRTTTSVTATYRPHPRADFRLDAYRRDASLDPLGLDQVAQGFLLSGGVELEPGWTAVAGAGATETDAVGEDALPAFRVGLTTPGRYRVSGGLTVAREPLDRTALQVLRAVTVDRVTADLRWFPAPRWRLTGSGSLARYEADQANDRWEAAAGVFRTVDRDWRLGLGVRAFGFEGDLDDGYFDPGFYGIAEATGRWSGEWNRWIVALEAAPGVQQIEAGGEVSATFRSAARITYSLAPGREIHVTGAVSNTGLHSAFTGEGYWHRSLVVGASWVAY